MDEKRLAEIEARHESCVAWLKEHPGTDAMLPYPKELVELLAEVKRLNDITDEDDEDFMFFSLLVDALGMTLDEAEAKIREKWPMICGGEVGCKVIHPSNLEKAMAVPWEKVKRKYKLEAEVKRLREAMEALEMKLRAEVRRSCGHHGGEHFCEEFGCLDLIEIADALRAVLEGKGE